MKAVQILGPKGSHQIVLSLSLPKPEVANDEILIRVHAAGLTADEVGWPEVYNTPSRIPGHDISGVVEQLGPSYRGPLSVGDAVFSMLHADRGQGQADYVVALPGEAVRKPARLSHPEAAALPIPVLTAWEALFKRMKVQRGGKILVTGASGAVGAMLVQLAKQLLDIEVVALASAKNHAYLRELGASQTVDYATPDWEASVHDVDAVLDTVGDVVLAKTWATVKPRGTIITVADPAPSWAFGPGEPEELAAHPEVQYGYFIVAPDSEALEQIAARIDDGTLKPLPVTEFPVEQAVEAWEFAGRRSRSGKVVIKFMD
ncbi:NAD(P)-binding protein [Thozetella sp. PMI_491]|nr:NAD(P)-binding protein [Thozetella sp. PMI_491]